MGHRRSFWHYCQPLQWVEWGQTFHKILHSCRFDSKPVSDKISIAVVGVRQCHRTHGRTDMTRFKLLHFQFQKECTSKYQSGWSAHPRRNCDRDKLKLSSSRVLSPYSLWTLAFSISGYLTTRECSPTSLIFSSLDSLHSLALHLLCFTIILLCSPEPEEQPGKWNAHSIDSIH